MTETPADGTDALPLSTRLQMPVRAAAVFGAERAKVELYEAICTTRAIRRLRPDPIPEPVLARILGAATCAPTGGNAQPWRVLVVRDAARKRALAEHFTATWETYSSPGRQRMERLPDQTRARGMKVMAAGDHLARHFAEVPVVLVFCHDPRMLAQGGADDPQPKFLFGGSLYPAIQNLLLACRAEGLGGVLTTMIWRREAEVLRTLEIPEPWRIHAVVPIGYPQAGGHGPLARKPVSTMAYLDRWGTAYPAPSEG
jgi:nitroreductase